MIRNNYLIILFVTIFFLTSFFVTCSPKEDISNKPVSNNGELVIKLDSNEKVLLNTDDEYLYFYIDYLVDEDYNDVYIINNNLNKSIGEKIYNELKNNSLYINKSNNNTYTILQHDFCTPNTQSPYYITARWINGKRRAILIWENLDNLKIKEIHYDEYDTDGNGFPDYRFKVYSWEYPGC